MKNFKRIFEEEKDSPAIQEIRKWIEEDLHKSIVDIRDVSIHRDIINIGRDMNDPNSQHHQYPNLIPAAAEVTFYFNGDDMPSTKTMSQ